MRDITSCKLNFEKSNTAPLYREIGYYPVLSKNRIQTTFYREIEYRPDESRNRIDLIYREIEYRPVLSRNRHYPDESRKRNRAISFLFDN